MSLSDEELLAELMDGSSVPVVDMPVACGRLDTCLKCQFAKNGVCMKSNPAGQARFNLASMCKRAGVTCPEGLWPA